MSATVATPDSFNSWQLEAIEDTERVCSVLSLLGTTFIIGSFICSTSFRKPINRVVFYASWGNTMANIATLISRSGLHHGVMGPLCQFQAFFIQWSVTRKLPNIVKNFLLEIGSCLQMRCGYFAWHAMCI